MVSVGDRVRLDGQRYPFAQFWGTATVLSCDDGGYVLRHDAGSRLAYPDAVTEDWHAKHHVVRSAVQFNDSSLDFVMFASKKDSKRLAALGFVEGVHYRVGDV